jgi:MFS-type transporter involved in bile tolerance (Atg22 family)
MLSVSDPWLLVAGGLLITNWEPLSVPATFDVVGSEVPKNRRTIAFAMASIQKRVPKIIGPLIGGLVFLKTFKLNLSLAVGILGVSILTQIFLLSRMKAKPDPKPVPLKEIMRDMPNDLRMLLSAEILLRWGDWFVRDFAGIYVVFYLNQAAPTYGQLAALTSFTALVTYIPIGKIIDASKSPKPYIGATFLLFSLFPICLVLLPKSGLPMWLALAITFIVNGLREMGEPARKAMIASGFPPEYRARAVGLYWGLRSFAFFPAPIIAYLLWTHFGPDVTFLVGGGIGLVGTAWFWLRVKCE